ncbi:SLAM family member 9-like [Engystomops pustulosus]|uniref:SLAM family member 9-like n=1 Tax=Engystomops pustulosus TaxID=76066 RepID=UPI003AFAB303
MKPQESVKGFYALLTVLILLVPGGEAVEHTPALLHEEVTFSYVPTEKTATISVVRWWFDGSGGGVLIMLIAGDNHHSPHTQFTGRLQKSEDPLTLTIRNLTMEDAGIYRIDVVQENRIPENYSWNVTLYEPVPRPHISAEVMEDTADLCNFTLHCTTPSSTSQSHLPLTWLLSDAGVLYGLNVQEEYLQTAVKSDSRAMTIHCIVWNPVEGKNVSIQVKDICAAAGERGGRSLHLLIIKPLQCVLFLVPLIMYLSIRADEKKGSSTNMNVESHKVSTC